MEGTPYGGSLSWEQNYSGSGVVGGEYTGFHLEIDQSIKPNGWLEHAQTGYYDVHSIARSSVNGYGQYSYRVSAWPHWDFDLEGGISGRVESHVDFDWLFQVEGGGSMYMAMEQQKFNAVLKMDLYDITASLSIASFFLNSRGIQGASGVFGLEDGHQYRLTGGGDVVVNGLAGSDNHTFFDFEFRDATVNFVPDGGISALLLGFALLVLFGLRVNLRWRESSVCDVERHLL